MRDSFAANPFCTRFFQPGAIPFYFPPPMTLDSLVDRILSNPAPRLAIVGPHGSGKSTLVQHLLDHPGFNRFARDISAVRFSTAESTSMRWRVMRGAFPHVHARGKAYLLVDGWEQMNFVLQWYVRSLASLRGTRILATSHARPHRFTEIWRTSVDQPVEEHVLEHMLRESPKIRPATLVTSEAWRISRQRRGQNLRESLFDMYDWYRDEVDVESSGG